MCRADVQLLYPKQANVKILPWFMMLFRCVLVGFYVVVAVASCLLIVPVVFILPHHYVAYIFLLSHFYFSFAFVCIFLQYLMILESCTKSRFSWRVYQENSF